MRGRMNDAKSYAAPVQIGEVMVGGTVGRVEQSNDPDLQPGDIVAGNGGWQDYCRRRRARICASSIRQPRPIIDGARACSATSG